MSGALTMVYNGGSNTYWTLSRSVRQVLIPSGRTLITVFISGWMNKESMDAGDDPIKTVRYNIQGAVADAFPTAVADQATTAITFAIATKDQKGPNNTKVSFFETATEA